jgi:hypothetical protein
LHVEAVASGLYLSINQHSQEIKISGDSRMSNSVTLGSVERLAQKLPPAQQLELISRLSQRLSEHSIQGGAKARNEKKQRLADERRIHAEKLLAEMDAIAEKFPGRSNVVLEIRRMRNKRTKKIWKNVLTPM